MGEDRKSYIEGDNLEVLAAAGKLPGKVKMIYIDPPITPDTTSSTMTTLRWIKPIMRIKSVSLMRKKTKLQREYQSNPRFHSTGVQ